MDDLEASVAKLRQNHGALGKRYRAALLKYTTLDTTAQQAIDTEVRGMDRATSTGIDTLVSKLQATIEARFKTRSDNNNSSSDNSNSRCSTNESTRSRGERNGDWQIGGVV